MDLDGQVALVPEFVELMPTNTAEATLYVSMAYATTVHLCACGCGNKVVLPLGPAEWQMLSYEGEGETGTLTCELTVTGALDEPPPPSLSAAVLLRPRWRALSASVEDELQVPRMGQRLSLVLVPHDPHVRPHHVRFPVGAVG